MRFYQSCSTLLFAAALAAPIAAQAAPKYPYKAIELISFTAGQGSGVATLINKPGLICGALDRKGAFCYRDGKATELTPLPGDYTTTAHGLNDKGQVVGASLDINFNRRAVLFVDGTATELAVGSRASTSANAINNAGHIVGAYSDGGATTAYLYKDGAMLDLGWLGRIRSSTASAINNRGQIVGSSAVDNPDPFRTYFHAFLYENGVMQDLGTLGGPESQANAINDRGQVVGRSDVSIPGDFPWHAFVWENGVMKDLGAGVDGWSEARGVNNRGQVVGAAPALPGGFLYEPGKGLRALNDLVDPADGLNIVYPQSINDRQEIVGYGCRGQLCGPIKLVRVADDEQ